MKILNILLLFVPAAIAAEFMHASPVVVFALSAMAIIPLSGYLGRATEEIASYTGPTLGGLLNATLGNLAELIIAILALRAGLIDLVKASITGSILGNLLLVLGAAQLMGGLRHRTQTFSIALAGLSISLLIISVIGLVIPAVYHWTHVDPTRQMTRNVSIGVAVLLIIGYGLSLVYSMWTHRSVFNASEEVVDAAHAEEHGDAMVARARQPSLLLVSAGVVGWLSEILVGSTEAAIQTSDFTTEELRVATDAILADLVFGGDFAVEVNGQPVLNERERGHMADVRSVFRGLWVLAIISVVVLVAASRRADRGRTWRAVRGGAIGLSIGVVIAGVVGFFAFDQLFELFHKIFFPAGSYLFDPLTDRLVQLFPFTFWFETAMVVGVVIIGVSVVVAFVAGRRAAAHRAPSPPRNWRRCRNPARERAAGRRAAQRRSRPRRGPCRHRPGRHGTDHPCRCPRADHRRDRGRARLAAAVAELGDGRLCDPGRRYRRRDGGRAGRTAGHR